MYQFLLDAYAALRLKFYPTTHYHYSLPVMAAILILLGLINAASMSTFVAGQIVGLIAFSITLTITRWCILSIVMGIFTKNYGKAPTQWFGYVLVTEALTVPLICLFYWPKALATPGLFWLFWIMLVQLLGFARIGQQSMFKVAMAYIVYFLSASMASGMLMFIFINFGWLDMDSMIKALEQMLEIPPIDSVSP